jgi:hypothetical protein
MKKFLIAAFLLAASASFVFAQAAPSVRPAMDGIFDAFKTHPLVGIGEHHRVAQELDFYTALVRDPRFAKDVGNVVVEFGGAAHQDIIDRYIAGEDVPYAELRKVWTDTVGWIPVVPSDGYINFYAQIREINLSLPLQDRIHVWLGDPKIDWSKIKSHADWQALNQTRDSHPAELIKREILARGKKALIIYGGGHFFPAVTGPAGEKLEAAGFPSSWRALIDHDHPGALFVVSPYGGSAQKSCLDGFEKSAAAWPVPALVAPWRDSAMAEDLRRCNPIRAEDANFAPSLTDQEKKQIVTTWFGPASDADALLYLGPAAQLTTAPYLQDYFFDSAYFRELAQHYLLQTGQVLPPPKIADNPMSPKFRQH